MDNNGFNKVRNEYFSYREKERRRIIDCIAQKKDSEGKAVFTKVNGKEYDTHNPRNLYSGGKGISKYSSGKRLEKVYDLSNWKYIETSYKGNYVFISLQSFDIDPNSKNVHILFDRIGILYEKPVIKDFDGMKICDAFLKMKTTNWQLPLEDNEINKLVECIISHFESKGE